MMPSVSFLPRRLWSFWVIVCMRRGLWSWLRGVWIRCTVKQRRCWPWPHGRSASCPSVRCVPSAGLALVAMLLPPWLGCICVPFLTACAITSGVMVAPPCFRSAMVARVAGCVSIKLCLRSCVGGLPCLLLSPPVTLSPRRGLWFCTRTLLLCVGVRTVLALMFPASSPRASRLPISVSRSCLRFGRGSWPSLRRSAALMWS